MTKCTSCNTKIIFHMTKINTCRCKNVYCNLHIHQHECTFNYKQVWQDDCKKSMPKVYAE